MDEEWEVEVVGVVVNSPQCSLVEEMTPSAPWSCAVSRESGSSWVPCVLQQ